MAKAKVNFQQLSQKQQDKAIRQQAQWKWFQNKEFEDHLRILDWDDPDFPPGAVIECGNLARIHFRAPAGEGTHPRRRRDTTLTLSLPMAKKSYLVFDPESPDERLYMCIDKGACNSISQRFWVGNSVPARTLSQWATLAGGRHAKTATRPTLSRGGYPAVRAKPMGVMTAVVYYTHKKADGPSFYIHRFGEISCTFPILACDKQGRIWVCGGSYKNPTPGITD